VKLQWVANRCPSDRQVDPGELKALYQKFDQSWQDVVFRRRYCPGKQILKAVKARLQQEYTVAFSDESVFVEYQPGEIRDVFGRVRDHMTRALADASQGM
jgi:hypothetical protein